MSLSFGFYNSSNHDRVYDTRQISYLFNALIKDGVFMHIGSHFSVTAGSGMTVNVGTGYAWFNSTWTLNDAPLPITPEESDLLLTRIDALVLEVNETQNTRANSIKFVKGTPSANPQKPTLANTNDVHQYALAYITIAPGAESLSQSNIENNVGMESCPFVTGILETIDISSLISQWETQWNEWLEQQTTDFTSWSSARKEEILNFQSSSEASFLAWFENIKDKLGEDAAGGLQNQIDDLKAAVTGYPLAVSANTNSVQITAKKNSIENVKITGFTKQAGEGDASPNNVRAITTGGLQMAKVALTGLESWVLRFSGSIPPFFEAGLSILPFSGTDLETAKKTQFCSIAQTENADSIPADCILCYTSGQNATIRARFNQASSVDDLKNFLQQKYAQGNPVYFWLVPADKSKSTGIYLPKISQGKEYRCEMLELTSFLCDGGTVESCVPSGFDKKIIFDGITRKITSFSTSSHGYVTFVDKDGYDSSIEPISNYLLYKKSVYGDNPIGFNAYETSDGYGFNIKLPTDANEESYNTYLQQFPLVIYLRSTAYTEQNDIPVQLETHRNWAESLTGSENENWVLGVNGQMALKYSFPAPKQPITGNIASHVVFASGASGSGSVSIGFDIVTEYLNVGAAFVKSVCDGTLNGWKSYLADQNEEGTPFTVSFELSTPATYARDPVHVSNEDGVTTVSTQEGCILELHLSKNEAKTFKATFLMDSWQSSGSEFTQEASVRCIDGLGAITPESKWDSPIYVEQTSVLATNEKLIEALGILNMGEILFKDGAISCRVSEKPACDIEIIFKAIR